MGKPMEMGENNVRDFRETQTQKSQILSNFEQTSGKVELHSFEQT